ncbi:MAG: hypothetical protein MJ075_05790 [Oscillospiraceae bacterium]|nr:hypothetical protein [Oscillospiraceae bacterium]
MRRSNLIIRLVFVLILAAILCYFGIYLYNDYINPLRTVQVVSASASESASVSGYVVREEESLRADGVISPISDGKKVSAGGVVAVCYTSESALERADTILALQERITALQTALGETDSESPSDIIAKVSRAAVLRDMDSLDTLVNQARYVLFGSSESVDQAKEELDSARAELEELQERQSGYSVLLADRPGLFSASTDGYETVSPGSLATLTPEGLVSRFSRSPGRTGFGKLIYGTDWYYACIMTKADVRQLKNLNSVTVNFTSGYTGSVRMDVESIGEADANGNCLVVLSCDTGLADFATVRAADAEIIFSAQQGILIPEEALYDDYTGTYVYLLVGLQARRRDVEVLQDTHNGFLLVSPAEGSAFYAGATIIVNGTDLTDGKVVR